MKKDKIIIYSLEITLLLTLIFALFVSNMFSNTVLAAFLITYTLFLTKLTSKRNKRSIYQKQVIMFMIGFAMLYILAFYSMGFYFGYYHNPITLNFNSFIKHILPIASIIITSEIIRKILLSQKMKFSKSITYVCMVLIDLIIYTKVYDHTIYNDFLTILGLILFSSISCNLLYNYICIRFGDKSIIIYRLITILYIYLIPIIPDVLVFFRAILRMLYPYIIYLTLEYSYSKTNFAVAYKDKRKSIIRNTIWIITMLIIVMLISCKFRFGIIVIGSGSMTGTLNVGDAIIYESYDNQKIYKNDIIIFNKNNIPTIHRVVDVINSNGEIRYFTKGDANVEKDEGYSTSKDIIGIYRIKIKYIGYPTVWLRDIFND